MKNKPKSISSGLIQAGTVMVLACFLASCNKKNETNPVAVKTDSSNFTLLDAAPDTVRLSTHIQPIFTSTCATTGCHAGSSPKSGLNLESSKAFASLTLHTEIEHSAADPTGVRLFIKLTNPNGIMPPSGKMPYKQLNLIYQWLQKGAKNN